MPAQPTEHEDEYFASCQGVWLDVGELDRVVTTEDAGLFGSVRRIFG